MTTRSFIASVVCIFFSLAYKGDHALSADYLAGCDVGCEVYYEFPQRYKEHIKEMSEDELSKIVQDMEGQRFLEIDEVSLEPAEMGRFVSERLNIEFLIRDIDASQFSVTLISQKDRGRYIEEELLFDDSHIGSFLVLKLVPKRHGLQKHGLLPAIIGLHGHGETVYAFRDEHMGRELAEEGFIVILPDFKVIRIPPVDLPDGCRLEDIDGKISHYLMLKGFRLGGIRVYQTLLVLKYLQDDGRVDVERIGLIGHSGGSQMAGLVVWVAGGFIKAIVRDMELDFRDIMNDTVHCQTLPSLVPYTKFLGHPDRLGIKTLIVPYGFEGYWNQRKIKEFLLDTLLTTE